jgi:hypothetical protein
MPWQAIRSVCRPDGSLIYKGQTVGDDDPAFAAHPNSFCCTTETAPAPEPEPERVFDEPEEELVIEVDLEENDEEDEREEGTDNLVI